MYPKGFGVVEFRKLDPGWQFPPDGWEQKGEAPKFPTVQWKMIPNLKETWRHPMFHMIVARNTSASLHSNVV